MNKTCHKKEARIKEITGKLKAKVKERQAIAIFEDLAGRDPDAKAMLDELLSLGQTFGLAEVRGLAIDIGSASDEGV